MSVVGVDPGLGGALARYDKATGELDVVDMPTFTVAVGKRRRERIDEVALAEYFDLAKLMGVELVMIETVGGRPGQSASAAFTFGYGVGLIRMACISARLVIETVIPGTWKKLMKVPGKTGADPKAYSGLIVNRADECFPDHRGLWRGPKGGLSLDRAEAALLAKYAHDFGLNAVDTLDMDEWLERNKTNMEAP